MKKLKLYILITLGYKPLVRPEHYRYFFEVRGARIHCIGTKELCESFIPLLPKVKQY